MDQLIKCTRCGELKKREEFFPRPNRPKGIYSQCRQCTRESKRGKQLWRRKDYTKILAGNRVRRALKAKALPAWVTKDELMAIYETAVEMTKLTGELYHVDHLVPLRSPYVCGLHCPDNLRIVHGSVNAAKGNRVWPDMPQPLMPIDNLLDS